MSVADTGNLHTEEDTTRMMQMVERMVAEAQTQGATAAEIKVADDVGVSVTARDRDVEKVEFDRSKSFGVRVFIGQRKGVTSTSDTSDEAVVEAISRAIDMAKHTEPDPYGGLADEDRLATEFPDLGNYHPRPLDAESLTEKAIVLDVASMDYDTKVIPSDGSSAHAGSTISVMGNSLGFLQSHATTHYGYYGEAVVQDEEGNKQVEGWSCSHCDASKLDTPKEVGALAAERAVARLYPGSIKTGTYPVLFDAQVSRALFSALIGAISGDALYLKESYLCDSLGKQVATEKLTLAENPFEINAIGSCCYDRDGVATSPKAFIKDGIVESYALGTYSGRRLGMATTGNAGRICNLRVESPKSSVRDLMKSMKQGVLVTQLKGSGANILTGDYSTGIGGFWIENGEISFAIENVTVAGKLPEIFNQIVGFGDDVDMRRSMRTGSTLIESMTVAAA